VAQKSLPVCLHAAKIRQPVCSRASEDAYAAQKRAFEVGSLSTESTFPADWSRPNTAAEKLSEYNHHWAGILVLSIGLLALAAQAGKVSWARIGRWPSSVSRHFSFFEAIPNLAARPVGFWATLADPECCCIVFRVLVLSWLSSSGACRRAALASGVHGWPFRSHRVSGLCFSLIRIASEIQGRVLAELSHIPLAI